MRLAVILLLTILARPATGLAQPYRASVLWMPAAESVADTAAAGANAPPDSSRAFHPPVVASFDPKAGEPMILAPILCGLVGAAAFGYAGAAIGNSTDPGYSDDIPIGALSGYLIGETIGVPLGAHVGNAFRGNLAGDLGISILGQFLALGLGSIGGGAGYLAGIGTQIVATAVNEQKVGRRRAIAKHEREREPAAVEARNP